jgi:DNA-binding CsgD family transcriptional regulator
MNSEARMPERSLAELHEVRRQLCELDGQLAELGCSQDAAKHAEALEQLQERFELRFESLAQARAAATRLRRHSSASELLDQAPRALTAGTGFELALVSLIQDGLLLPVAASVEVDGEASVEMAERLRDQLQGSPFRLEHHRIESEVVRRRRAILVSNVDGNARVDRGVAAIVGWDSYVAAPLLSGASVIGLIHADRGPHGAVDVLDRDVLGEFAAVLSQLVETAELRRALRGERQALRRFVDRVSALSAALSDPAIGLSAYVGSEAEPTATDPAPWASGGSPADGDDRLVLSGLLTRRELDVVRLLAEGRTNRTIADNLVLSDTTVKFHVTSILRKLRVANRAEAVARYLALLGAPAPR